MTTQPINGITEPAAADAAELPPAVAWSRRVRRVGGFIQAAFAAFWLIRASLAIGGRAGGVLIAASGVAVIGVFAYAIRNTAGIAPRPAGPQASRIGRSVTAATVIQLAATLVLPVIIIAAGHPDWVSGPALAVTTGLAAGVLLLGNAAAGFHDLAGIRRARQPGPGQPNAKTGSSSLKEPAP